MIKDFKAIFKGRRVASLCVCLAVGFWLTNCDDLEVESVPTDTPIESIQRTVLVSPQNSGIFNLKSMLATAGNRRVAITSQPTLGTLQSLGNDLLRYSPNVGIANGRDKLVVSVFSPSNIIEKQDSIIVIISQDSTSLPCDLGVRATDDFIYNVSGPIDIVVMNNDTVCQVSRNQLKVTVPDDLIISGTPVPKSYFGSVEVLANGIIRYTPGASFKGDKFIYRVEKPENIPNVGDPATFGYGFVYLTGATASCKNDLRLGNDHFQFKRDSLVATDSLYLNTAANDFICTKAQNNFIFTIKEFPQGRLYYSYDYGFKYLIPANAVAGSTDRFTYSVCVDDVCKEAEVTIEFK